MYLKLIMKVYFKIIISLLLVNITCYKSQSIRYFEFRMLAPSQPEWRDTVIIAGTSTQSVIADVLSEIANTTHKHIKGPIASGNGGHNNNASHNFKWHFKVNQWYLEQFSEEVCDGRAFSDVDSDTAYWIGFLGYFCGWSYQPKREVFISGSTIEDAEFSIDLPRLQNPVDERLDLKLNLDELTGLILKIIDSQGRIVLNQNHFQSSVVDISTIENGLYTLILIDKIGRIRTTKISIE